MPDRTISFLSAVAAALTGLYVVLVVVTVTYATIQTDLALTVRDTESEIGMVESRYYEQVSALAATNPVDMNLSKPVSVTYATLAKAPSLSLR